MPKIVKLDTDSIDALFETAEHQADYLIGLYKLVYPNWDDITSVDGHPTCNENTWGMICQKAMTFDRKHHPKVMNGGLWMNSGFSSSDDIGLGDLEVMPAPYS